MKSRKNLIIIALVALINDTLKGKISNYSQIVSSVGSSKAPTIVTVNSDVEQTWILGISSNYRPNTWSTSNVVIKTA